MSAADARPFAAPATDIAAAAVRRDLVLVVAFAAALLVSPIEGRALSSSSIVACLIIAVLSLSYGRSLGRFLRLPAGAAYRSQLELVLGFCGISLAHLMWTVVLRLGALAALPLDLLVALALLALTKRCPQSGERLTNAAKTIWFDALTVLASAIVVCVWARETITAVPHAAATGVFRTWQDFLLHAAEVTYLRDYPTFGGHSLYLSGSAQPLYHRAGYAMAAVFSAVGRVSSLETATSFWMPTGLLLCVVAVFVFGAALGGRVGGVGAVAMAFLFPDASTYGFENRFLSFSWLIQMAGGSGYAIALTLIAVVVIVDASSTETRKLATGAMLTIAAGFFRIHVALLAFGMVTMLICLGWRPTLTGRRILALSICALIALGVLVSLEWVSLAPHFLTGRSHPMAFLLSVHMQANNIPTPYTSWTAGYPAAAKFIAGYAMLLLAGCGVLIPALMAVAWLGRFRSMGANVRSIPIALLLAHIAIILFVPTPAHGDITDFGHRPFVLVYAVFAGMVGAAMGQAIVEWSELRLGTERGGLLIVTALVLIGCSVPWKMGASLQQRWVSVYSTIPIGADDFEAGGFVRGHSLPGDLVLAESMDPLAVFVALTERSAFLSRGDLFKSLGGAVAQLAQERSMLVAPLASLRTYEDLTSWGRLHGVRWYIADRAASRQWPAAVRKHCAYCGPTVQVYDLQ